VNSAVLLEKPQHRGRKEKASLFLKGEVHGMCEELGMLHRGISRYMGIGMRGK